MATSALALVACKPAAKPPDSAAASAEWSEFEGSWNGVGTRRSIPLGPGRKASILALQGTMLLTGPQRPGAGFRANFIALVDSKTGLVGRSVWTDEHGDQAFSEIKGEGTATRNRIAGLFVGGTGRYADATGSYEFSWQSVMEGEDGSVQGRTIDLKGRVRPGRPAAGDLPR